MHKTSLKAQLFQIVLTVTVLVALAAAAAGTGSAASPAVVASPVVCPVMPLNEDARVTAAFAGVETPSRTLNYGRRSLIHGQLVDPRGFGLPGEPVCIEERPRIAHWPYAFSGMTTTRADGSWSFKLPSGSSRSIRVLYGGDPVAVATFLDLGVRAHATLHLSSHHARPHRRIYLSGHIPGPQPAKRVVILRGTMPGAPRRQLVKRARTDVFGHFRIGYAFSPVARPRKFVFWIVVPAQNGYPYRLGRSSKRFVRVSTPHRH
ncbi:MAG TPA: hypothetical protein VHQ43_06555 [Solirubrobacterales bacterium]|nr:hypothetical protein [Solirubrobacterales bacterium]